MWIYIGMVFQERQLVHIIASWKLYYLVIREVGVSHGYYRDELTGPNSHYLLKAQAFHLVEQENDSNITVNQEPNSSLSFYNPPFAIQLLYHSN